MLALVVAAPPVLTGQALDGCFVGLRARDNWGARPASQHRKHRSSPPYRSVLRLWISSLAACLLPPQR
eukprot:7409565-Alexandrium_andersonii.AAC.1